MATDTDLRCTTPGNVADGNWTRGGTIYVYQAVGGESDSMNIYTDNYNTGLESWTMAGFSASGIPTYCVINSITLWYYAARSGTGEGTMKSQWNLSGGAFSSGASNTPAGWTWYSDTMSRPGGGSWTRSDIANIGVRFYGNANATQQRNLLVDGFLLRVNWDYITLASLTASTVSTKGQTTATLPCSYDANGDGDTEWRIMYKASGGSYDDPSWTASSNTGSNSVSRDLTGLTAGTTYYFKLQARNSANTVQESSEQSFTTDASTGGLILFF